MKNYKTKKMPGFVQTKVGGGKIENARPTGLNCADVKSESSTRNRKTFAVKWKQEAKVKTPSVGG